MSDNGKMNQFGRLDYFGSLRHRIVELCSVRALAFHLYNQFDLQEGRIPQFASDHSDSSVGEFGGSWWGDHVFYATGKDADPKKEMTYFSTYLLSFFSVTAVDLNSSSRLDLPWESIIFLENSKAALVSCRIL